MTQPVTSLPDLTIKVKKLVPHAILPQRQHATDTGLDVFVTEVTHAHDNVYTVNFGIAVEPPAGFYVDLVARSSVHRANCFMANGVGIIDDTYRGPVCMNLYANSAAELPKVGDRFGQLILRRLYLATVEDVTGTSNDLSQTVRGEGGFGSTGK